MVQTPSGSAFFPARRERGGAVLVLLLVIVAIALVAAVYLYGAVHWSYSDGERAGVLQKLSRKGWVCKTWEGEMAMSTVPGVAPTIWSFTVRDAGVAAKVRDALGKRVALHYTEHHGLPGSCFGETPYFVDEVRIVE